jgi:hypothetical protein
MKTTKMHFLFGHAWLLASLLATPILLADTPPPSTAQNLNSAADIESDPRAKELMAKVGAKLAAARTLRVEVDEGAGATEPFNKDKEILLMRDSFIRIDSFNGLLTETRAPNFISDGKHVWLANRRDYIMEKRPVRPEHFHYGNGAIVQYFFSPKIEFSPIDSQWGQSVSIFDTNENAYNRFVTLKHLGERTVNGEKLQVVQMHFNAQHREGKQTFYINSQDLIVRVDTQAPGWFGVQGTGSVVYRNYRIDAPMTPAEFAYAETTKMPVREVDPVRLGEVAPDFELPLNVGGTVKLSELLKGKKGVFIATLNGAAGNSCKGPDYYLAAMRVLQQVRDKFESQGLEVVAIVGGDRIVPEVKDMMLRAWLPDQTRFSYPIAIDIDVERGIQGSAYHNFNFNGRNNILLDAERRAVFACNDLAGLDGNKANETALYLALDKIGFTVSPADMERIEFDERLYTRPGN